MAAGKRRSGGVGTVYFVEAVGAGLIKIGFTARPLSSRLTQLRASSPVPLAVLGITAGGKATEARTHARFLSHWSHGEWFRDNPELRAHIGRVATPWEPPAAAARTRPIVSRLPKVITAREWASQVYITYRGETRTAAEWANVKAVPVLRIKRLLENGVIPDDLFSPLPRTVAPDGATRVIVLSSRS